MDIDLDAKQLYQALIGKNKDEDEAEVLLLCQKRDEGPNEDLEPPLFSAARYGQMKMFKFLDDELDQKLGDEFAEMVHEKDDGTTTLHAAIDAEHFELAFWIATEHEYLHDKKNREGLTALQLLACNPLAFQFRGKGLLKTFIDSCIKNNNEDEDISHLHEDGNSILHMVGQEIRNEAVEQTEKRSPFFRLQDDLLLFERIKKVIKPHFYKHRNRVGQTAEELLALNKEALREKSQEWLKRTAENCSIIAVLIATVAFAAAYTIPGGSKSNGSPVLLNQTFFIIFTIGDVLSLTFCLTAVVIFMSILTSSYRLQEFKLKLPQKLMLGITCLLLSVTMMMLAFSATIILMIHNKEQWTKIALYTVAFLPVTVLVTVYMSLYWSLMKTFKHTLTKIRSFLPKSNSKNIDQSLGEKSNTEADVLVACTTTIKISSCSKC